MSFFISSLYLLSAWLLLKYRRNKSRKMGKIMKFRPCIDIHNGKVKQIVGGSLKDKGNEAVTNFTSELDAGFYAEQYKRDGLRGGHIILLNAKDSQYYEETRRQAMLALSVYPQGLQIGGGITAENAAEYLASGASHVIVTSYVFAGGKINWENLKRLSDTVGKEHIVLDLSCRKKDGKYYVVTDRWQTFTDTELTAQLLEELSQYCDEFLVHGVDVEGKATGVEVSLVQILAKWDGLPITYAGGIGSMSDLETFKQISGGKLDFTIGSALDLFGGNISYEIVKKF